MNELLTGNKLLRRLKENANYVLNTSCLVIYRSGANFTSQAEAKNRNSNRRIWSKRSGRPGSCVFWEGDALSYFEEPSSPKLFVFVSQIQKIRKLRKQTLSIVILWTHLYWFNSGWVFSWLPPYTNCLKISRDLLNVFC